MVPRGHGLRAMPPRERPPRDATNAGKKAAASGSDRQLDGTVAFDIALCDALGKATAVAAAARIAAAAATAAMPATEEQPVDADADA